ncbi:hypothetical protein [Paenibacillus sp. GYB003]
MKTKIGGRQFLVIEGDAGRRFSCAGCVQAEAVAALTLLIGTPAKVRIC